MWAWIVGTKNGLPLVYSPMYRIHSIDVPDTYTIPAEWWHGQSNTAGYGRYYNPSSTPGNPYNSNYSYGSGCGNNSNSGNGHVVWDNQFGPIGSSSDLINRPIFGHEDLRREMREVTSFGIEVNVIGADMGVFGVELAEINGKVEFFVKWNVILTFGAYVGTVNAKSVLRYEGWFLSGTTSIWPGGIVTGTHSIGMDGIYSTTIGIQDAGVGLSRYFHVTSVYPGP
jgi:hypothetical protein